MSVSVSLSAVVDEMELLEDGMMHAFLNTKTGELYGGTEHQIGSIDEDDDAFPDWEVEIIQRLREIVDSPDWVELPTRNSYDDYIIMEQFCRNRCEGPLQDELLSAIQGRGAFGRFKDAVVRHGIRDAWFAYRRECLEEEAKEWLEANDIPFKP
jgi:hypothetical protein